MEKKDYFRLEEECEFRFRRMGPCYHLCTGEDSPLLFHNEEPFRVAMDMVAFTLALFPDITILTFQLMSNHLHFALCGSEERIRLWFGKLVSSLASHPALAESKKAISALEPRIFPVDSLENMRNVIAYINRNGFIVDYNHTPFSYPWGANKFFFNTEAKQRYESLKEKATMRWKRQAFHSNLADNLTGIFLIDGYVSPICFCDVNAAEGLFRNAQHYFSKIAKSIESSASIARMIGESFYYLDDELYSIVVGMCTREYNCKTPSMIPVQAKLALARKMRFDYNASVKQISRILKLDVNSVKEIFPEI